MNNKSSVPIVAVKGPDDHKPIRRFENQDRYSALFQSDLKVYQSFMCVRIVVSKSYLNSLKAEYADVYYDVHAAITGLVHTLVNKSSFDTVSVKNENCQPKWILSIRIDTVAPEELIGLMNMLRDAHYQIHLALSKTI
jgi:hypothetical protein